eukprot:5472972-Prymnesium_polylepis.3
MALKSGPCGRCVRLTRGETARQSGADLRLHNHGIATTPAPRAGPRVKRFPDSRYSTFKNFNHQRSDV